MNEALRLIQNELAKVVKQRDEASERIRKAKEWVDLAQQEQALYNDQIKELEQAAQALQKLADKQAADEAKAAEEKARANRV